MCLLRPWQVRRTLCPRHFRSRGCPRPRLQSVLATPRVPDKSGHNLWGRRPRTSPDTCGLTACQPIVRRGRARPAFGSLRSLPPRESRCARFAASSAARTSGSGSAASRRTAEVEAAYAGSRPGVRRFVTSAAQPAVDAWVMIRRTSPGSRSWVPEPLPAFAAAPAAGAGSGGGTGSHWTSERLP